MVRDAGLRPAPHHEAEQMARQPQRPYFAGSGGRDVQVISAGWHAMPILEQLMASASARAQLRHLSVQARQVLSRSP